MAYLLKRDKNVLGLRIFVPLLFCCLPLLAAADPPESTSVIQQPLHKPFTISLKSNPSTGYKWQAKFNENMVTLVKETYEKSPEKLIGAAGQQVFVFRPDKTGDTEIEFVYQRPWEKDFAKRQVYRIKVSP
jgi:predicted secreted protein